MFHKATSILVIEDDPQIWELVELAFDQDHYNLVHAWNGAQAIEFINKDIAQILLCDVKLPDANGVDLCRYAKNRNPRCQILIMTSLGTVIDKVLGLEAGADDYITKPFNESELRARVRSAVRRVETLALSPAEFEDSSKLIKIADLKISLVRRQAWRQGRELDLTPTEFDLLCLLAESPGRVYSRQHLLEAIWPEKEDISDLTLNGHIRRLRGKVDEPFSALPLIDTVRGTGYRLHLPEP